MFKTMMIQNDQRGLLFTKGSYTRYLLPGTYRFSIFSDVKVEVLNVTKPFEVPGKDLQLFLQDERLRDALEVIDVRDSEYVLLYEDGKFARLCKAGKYAFWKGIKEYRAVRVNLLEPELAADIDLSILPKLGNMVVQVYDVAAEEAGLLYYNNQLVRRLAPGKYYFWRGPVAVAVKTIDLRRQQLDMTGQEMLTEDKVPLRLNFVCQYQVTDPLQTVRIRSMEEQIYVSLQLILREYVGTLKLDDLLRMKHEIGAFVHNRLSEQQEEYGVQFLSAGVKDIILPGDVKDILNTVLIAEKRAHANLITRREETASTRSLLNTAKLMDENATLMRLKELEYLEKICEKIGTISLTGSGGLLEQLNTLLKPRTD
ncbi:SPFH domain/Band 7 family protein [Paenibacillus taihuensis]|uniref:SPFH domain/Band 7 family protein n=1 Tax=Paenibacillus taihuensis TaxID=1156355 RepID=A0A3D9RU24_9BACL|nr:slipin family protein [Paenibacillus taihuensis]REE80212.1 SPFH domain/Band 7 family protein [Paenibacillus taihuensis]